MEMSVLDPREGYRLWAPTYGDENPVTFLEDRLVRDLTPDLEGLRLLDAGCGTGRRLRHAGAAQAVGVDASPEMLDICRLHLDGLPGVHLQLGDVLALPVADGAFDVLWCRLVIGHVADCPGVYRELARVADVRARIVVSDFHPEAYRAGHRRTFRTSGEVHEVEHYVHDVVDHLAAASEAGLELEAIREARIGPEVWEFYASSGHEALYRRDEGLPIVLALAFRKTAATCGS